MAEPKGAMRNSDWKIGDTGVGSGMEQSGIEWNKIIGIK